MATLDNLKRREEDGKVERGDFEQALIDTATSSGNGWNGTFAMVTLGVMYLAHSIDNVAIAIRVHAGVVQDKKSE
jgi:hypothetical protein